MIWPIITYQTDSIVHLVMYKVDEKTVGHALWFKHPIGKREIWEKNQNFFIECSRDLKIGMQSTYSTSI